MPCFGPLTAYYGKERSPNGKRPLVFKREDGHSGVAIKIPCGRCTGCRLEYARQWAMRCMHEKRMHDKSAFVTLTYDDEHLPPYGTLVLEDLQKFMKRLRERRRVAGLPNVRFYACGEYGDLNKRPHYHLLLFNTDFPDKRFHSTSNGNDLFTSAELAELWPVGFNLIGEVTWETAGYVARYVLKKVNGKQKEAGHYEVYDEFGELRERLPEFTVMSLKPGIGTGYYEKFKDEVFAHDSVVVNGREVRPPRFYDNKFEKACEDAFAVLKRKRRKLAVLNKADNTHKRLLVKEVIQLKALKQLKRSV